MKSIDNSLSNDVAWVEVTATATGQNLIDILLASADWPAKYTRENVLTASILPQDAAGVDRPAILLGQSAALMKCYIPGGIPAQPPVAYPNYFVKRHGGADVVCIVEVHFAPRF